MNVNGDTPHHPRYHFSHFLGHGSDGRVYKAQYVGSEDLGSLKPGTNVAIKLVPAAKLRVREVLLQAQLRHLNIVQLYDIFEYSDGLAMVMELADAQKLKLDGPSLWDCIKSCVEMNQRIKVYEMEARFDAKGIDRFRRPLKGGEPTLRWVFLQVAAALDYLHRHPQRLCNRDVKPHNVLVMGFAPHRDNIFRPVIKLADFGFCRATDVEPAVSRLGTPAYAAPEIITQRAGVMSGYDGPKADVWSAGVLLYVLTAGIEPFKEKSDLTRPDANNAVMRRIAEGNYRIFDEDRIGKCPEKISPELLDLLKRMLNPNPQERLTMLQVIQHPWSQKLNTDIQIAPAPEGDRQYLPAWDLLYANIQSSIATAEQNAAGEWTLPMPRTEVEELLNRVKERAR